MHPVTNLARLNPRHAGVKGHFMRAVRTAVILSSILIFNSATARALSLTCTLDSGEAISETIDDKWQETEKTLSGPTTQKFMAVYDKTTGS